MILINRHRSTNKNIWKPKIFLTSIVILTIVITTFITFITSKNTIQLELEPELERKSRVIGKTILNPIERALKLGIELQDLRGVEEHFQTFLEDNPTLISLSLMDKNGKVLFKKDSHKHNDIPNYNFVSKINFQHSNNDIGFLTLALDFKPLTESHLETYIKLLIILCAASIFLYEVSNYLLRYQIQEPMQLLVNLMARIKKGDFTEEFKSSTKDEISLFGLALSRLSKKTANLHHKMISIGKIQAIIHEESQKQIGQQIEKINQKFRFAIPIKKLNVESVNQFKICIFGIAFTEALANTFIVFFAADLHPLKINMPLSILLSLPIVLYMLGYAFSITAFNTFNQVLSRFPPQIMGALLYCSGSLGSSLSYSFFDFSFWRTVSGLGFGLLMVSYSSIRQNSDQQSHTNDTDFFTKSFYGGYLCGLPLGSLLAISVGYKLAFVIITLLSLAFTIMTLNFPEKDNSLSRYNSPNLLKNYVAVMMDQKIRYFLIFISFSSRFVVGSCLLFFVPFYCYTMNISLLWVAVALSLYPMPIYLFSSFYGLLLNKTSPLILLITGHLVVSISGVFLILSDGLHGLFLLTLILGLGHSLSLNAQDIFLKPVKEKASMHSSFKFIELLGLPLGALSMGVLLSQFDSNVSVNLVLAIHACFLGAFIFYAYKKNNFTAPIVS